VTTTSRLRILAAAAVVSVAAAALVLSTSQSAPAAASAAAAAGIDPRAGGLQVALGEWSVGLEAKAIRPGRVTLVITNRGKQTHGFEVEAARSRDGGDDDNDLDAETDKLRPGETTRLTLDLAPGVYEIECFVSHHDDMGMVARLVVSADAPLVVPPKAPVNTVQILNFAFKPAVLTTKVGSTVRWRNQDPAQHTATARNDAFGSKLLGRGGTYARKFTAPGTYAYICALHPSMTGKVVVR
jgi:plastocyanin